MNTLYIVVPAYNESENIEALINDWYPVVESHNESGNSRLVIINDGSKDNTYEMICKAGETRPLLVAQTKPNGGHGSTVLYGYRYAIDHGADYVFQTDSDGQTLPSEFDEFWNLRNEYDAIIGDRSDRQDGKGRVFVEHTLLTLLRIMFGVKMPDSNAPFRLMKCDLVRKYLPLMPENYNLPNVILTTVFVKFKEKVTFRHVTFRPRQGGVNSINFKKIFKIGIQAIKDFIQIKKNMKGFAKS